MYNLYSKSKIKTWFLLILLSLGAGTIYLTPFLLNQFVNQIQIITSQSLVDLQLLLTIYGIVSLILYIPGGWIADRFSPKLLFSTSMLCASILTFWYCLIGINGIIDYTQLALIHVLFAIVNSLIFWSAFIKAIGLLDEEEHHVKLYANCEILRNASNVIVGFISVALTTIVVTSSVFNENGGWALFIILVSYGTVYLITAILSAIFMPGPWIQRYTKKTLEGLFEFKPICSTKIIVAASPEELRSLKNEYTKKFWQNVWTDFVNAIKNINVWLIALLIFFVMNVYATITAFGTIFSINYEIENTIASLSNFLYNYATPIIGALVLWKLTDKKTKSPSKSTFHANIWLVIFSIVLVIICGFDSNEKLTIGIIGIVLMGLIMLVIGGNRAVYWSIMTELNIPLGVVGVTVGFVSIIGFSENIWVNPVVASIMQPFRIGELDSNLYSRHAFMYIYIFNLVNAIGALITSYVIYQRRVFGKLFTKQQVITKDIWMLKIQTI